MGNTIKISRDDARFEMNPPALIHRKMIDHRRWDITHEIVFQRDGKFWRGYYDIPATECQDGQEYDSEVECREVIPVQKTITDYEDAK